MRGNSADKTQLSHELKGFCGKIIPEEWVDLVKKARTGLSIAVFASHLSVSRVGYTTLQTSCVV